MKEPVNGWHPRVATSLVAKSLALPENVGRRRSTTMNQASPLAASSEPDSEIELFRDHVRRFLAKEVEPHYAQWEAKGIVPRSIWQALGEAGFLCIDVPEEYGGGGADFRFNRVIIEEASRKGYMGLQSNIAVHSDIVALYILHLGTEEQKQHWLPRMARGEAVGAVAMTEPGAGSDLQGIRTHAVADGDDFIINGSKTFISNGQHANVIITVAKTDPSARGGGITLFLVDSASPGFARGRNLEKLGQHCADTSELSYTDVRVPKQTILGRLGGGFGHLVDELARERLACAIAAVAHAQGALDLAVDYTTTRKAFGQALAQFQNTRFALARAKTEVEVHRGFVNQCADRFARGELDVTTAAMAKYACAEMEWRVIDSCLQLFGGYGYMQEYPISRFLADARVQRIYGGTSEIMLEIVARSVVGR
jgi:acyl-CoA dehydrogenase